MSSSWLVDTRKLQRDPFEVTPSENAGGSLATGDRPNEHELFPNSNRSSLRESIGIGGLDYLLAKIGEDILSEPVPDFLLEALSRCLHPASCLPATNCHAAFISRLARSSAMK